MQEAVSPLQNKRLVKSIRVPGDKSISHRSVILGSISQGKTEISNFLEGEDCLCTLDAFAKMGVRFEKTDKLIIHGSGSDSLQKPSSDIYLGNSGTGMRLLTGLFTALPFATRLTGDASLESRPMKRIIDPLSKMGAHIDSHEGKAPLLIQPVSRLQAINYESPIASAQVKSSILLAGLNAEGVTQVTEPHKSRDHLERMLQYFGADLNVDSRSVAVRGVESIRSLKASPIMVPSDISSAAFYMVAAAIIHNAQITILDVGINPTRTGIIDVLRMMNVEHFLSEERLVNNEPIADITVQGSSIKATTIGGEDLIPRLIDEIPIIAILASQATGTTIIKDAEELKVKESNRIRTTVNLLRMLGVQVEETEDGMVIEGRSGRPFQPIEACYDSHGDHRLAMSAAIASLHSERSFDILQTEFVNTSFPGFFSLLNSLHAN